MRIHLVFGPGFWTLRVIQIFLPERGYMILMNIKVISAFILVCREDKDLRITHSK